MTDCILWHKSCNRNGYGQDFRDGQVVYAHRAEYERAHGPIPPEMTVHHLCETRACVNPAHMELLRRDDHSGGLGHGKLTREQARDIRGLADAGWSRRWIGAAYGVSDSLVVLIGQRARWADA